MQPENQTGEEVMTEYMFKRYEKYRAKSKKYKAKFETAQRENASLKNIIGCLVSSSERQPGKEFNILQLPALNGFVVVVGNTVRVFDENADHVKVSTEEWEKLRADLRFDDSVNYENGETPMTVNQFKACVELSRKNSLLREENARLTSEISK